jgi:hypothetical protein
MQHAAYGRYLAAVAEEQNRKPGEGGEDGRSCKKTKADGAYTKRRINIQHEHATYCETATVIINRGGRVIRVRAKLEVR